MKHQTIMWDHREQVDLHNLNMALKDQGFEGCVQIVEATGNDQFAIIVASEDIDVMDAQEIYDNEVNEDFEG